MAVNGRKLKFHYYLDYIEDVQHYFLDRSCMANYFDYFDV